MSADTESPIFKHQMFRDVDVSINIYHEQMYSPMAIQGLYAYFNCNASEVVILNRWNMHHLANI